MGLFDDIETPVDEIESGLNGHRIKPGAYDFQLTDITKLDFDEAHANMPNQSAIIFELTVVDGDEDEIGHTFTVFCRVPNEEEQGDKAKMFASILKQNMLQFGIPESRLSKWDPENPDDVDAIMGITGTGQIKVNKKNSDYDNLYNFKLTEESGASDTELSPTSGAFDASAWKKG